MRRASKVDLVQAEIVRDLNKAGICTQSIAAIGGGCPDLVWGFRGRCGLLELKTPGNGTAPERRVAQANWREKWAGPVAVVTTSKEAIDAVLEACK